MSKSTAKSSAQSKVLKKGDNKDKQIRSKDLDENRLIKLLNSYWSKASFGYPIHKDVRIPTSVADTLRTES